MSMNERYQAVKRILDFHPNIYGLIFCRTRRTTQDIADKLLKDGYNAAPLHEDLSQMQEIKQWKNLEKNITNSGSYRCGSKRN